MNTTERTYPDLTRTEREDIERTVDYIVDIGVLIENTIVDGIDDNYQREVYAKVRNALAREIASTCCGEWFYMDKAIKAEMYDEDNTIDGLRAANRLIMIEAQKLAGEKIDQANGYIKAACKAWRRYEFELMYAMKMADWASD